MNVAYLGPLLDYSGYGEANRHAVMALEAANVCVVGQLVNYTSDAADFGEIGKKVGELIERKDDYRIKIMHTTPDQFKRHMEKGKYHIAHFFWETDKVPEQFAEGLRDVDEIWTGSEANLKAIRAAGVQTPTYIYPQATETKRDWGEPYDLDGFDGLLFYSIFEWIDRKNPEALLRAYYEEFQNGENVGLLIKSYFRDFTLRNKNMISQHAKKLKEDYNGKAPVFIYKELMDRKQINRIHKTGDVFVSAHRGEGWGVPQVEAMLAGNPIISTNYGGVHEYLKDDRTAMLAPYKMIPVSGMSHSRTWYAPDQNWADVDVEVLRGLLRHAYDSAEYRAQLGRNGRLFAARRFNFARVGKVMADRLEEIEGSL